MQRGTYWAINREGESRANLRAERSAGGWTRRLKARTTSLAIALGDTLRAAPSGRSEGLCTREEFVDLASLLGWLRTQAAEKDLAMPAALSKLMNFLSVPSNVIAALAVLGLVMLLLRRRSGAAIAAVTLVALAGCTLSPLGNMLLTPLEQRFPDTGFPTQRPDGIIVLGGSYDTTTHGYLSTIYLEEDTEPMAVVPDLARRYPEARIIFSGGTDPSTPGPSEAGIAKQYFISFGIAPERILIEEHSQTTEQNARFTAGLIHPTPEARFLLVTSSYHMPRAMGAFRKAGFKVVAFPVGSRTRGWSEFWRPAPTATDNLRRLDIAAHEWLGLMAYRLSGYSNELFAGP